MVPARISDCLTDIWAWMQDYHLQLNLTKERASQLPSLPIRTAPVYHPVHQPNPIVFGQKFWRDP